MKTGQNSVTPEAQPPKAKLPKGWEVSIDMEDRNAPPCFLAIGYADALPLDHPDVPSGLADLARAEHARHWKEQDDQTRRRRPVADTVHGLATIAAQLHELKHTLESLTPHPIVQGNLSIDIPRDIRGAWIDPPEALWRAAEQIENLIRSIVTDPDHEALVSRYAGDELAKDDPAPTSAAA